MRIRFWGTRGSLAKPGAEHDPLRREHHIQGYSFFAPLFEPGNEWQVYAPQSLRQQLEDTLAGQMAYTYFPVNLSQFGATIRYHELAGGGFELGSVRETTHFLNHPGLAMGYRLEAAGVTSPTHAISATRNPRRVGSLRCTVRISVTSNSSQAPTL